MPAMAYLAAPDEMLNIRPVCFAALKFGMSFCVRNKIGSTLVTILLRKSETDRSLNFCGASKIAALCNKKSIGCKRGCSRD